MTPAAWNVKLWWYTHPDRVWMVAYVIPGAVIYGMGNTYLAILRHSHSMLSVLLQLFSLHFMESCIFSDYMRAGFGGIIWFKYPSLSPFLWHGQRLFAIECNTKQFTSMQEYYINHCYARHICDYWIYENIQEQMVCSAAQFVFKNILAYSIKDVLQFASRYPDMVTIGQSLHLGKLSRDPYIYVSSLCGKIFRAINLMEVSTLVVSQYFIRITS